jgi:general stress protein CsbA
MWWARGRVPAWVLSTAQVCARLLVAFVLGALAGPYADLGLRVPADIAFRFSIAVLLLPVLAVILFETVPQRRWVTAVVAGLLLLVAAVVVARFDAADPHADWVSLLTVGQWLSLLLVPVAAGFVLGGARPGGRAIGVGGGAGLVAWAGVGLHHLLLAGHAGAFSDTGPAGALGKPLLIFLLVVFAVEVPAAAVGGLLGGVIRARLSHVPLWEQPTQPVGVPPRVVGGDITLTRAPGSMSMPAAQLDEGVAIPTTAQPDQGASVIQSVADTQLESTKDLAATQPPETSADTGPTQRIA